MKSKKNGFIQPIWKTTFNRRVSAVVAWIGAAVVLLSMFLFPVGKVSTGSGLAGMLASSVLDVLLPVSSFTLFQAGMAQVLILVLLIVALVAAIVIPFLTVMPLELIPFAMLIGTDIYVAVQKMNILAAVNVKALGKEVTSDSIGSYVTELEAVASNLNILSLGIGYWISIAGAVLMLISVVLWFVLKPKENKKVHEKDISSDENTAGGSRYAETVLATETETDTESDSGSEETVAMDLPPARLVRLNTGEVFLIREGEVLIGRDANRVDFVIGSNFISGIHAKLITSHGYSGIVDMHSTNGTFVNDQRLVPDIKVALKDGDYVSLGAEILQYHQRI